MPPGNSTFCCEIICRGKAKSGIKPQMNDSKTFYSSLSSQALPLSRLYQQPKMFHQVPKDWHVLITDVVGSSNAVASGNHQTINLIATGSIVAVLNIVHAAEIEIPFFFGGDGATFLVPGSVLEKAMIALQEYQANVMQEFQLFLRVGSYPVAKIYEAGKTLKLCKNKISPLYIIPVLVGEGLMYAENIIKSADNNLNAQSQDMDTLSLAGLQCRWDKIPPPTDHEEVVSLLVMAKEEDRQGEVFSNVMKQLDLAYGDVVTRRSISIPKLKLATDLNKIRRELQVRMNKNIFVNSIISWIRLTLGKVYFKTGIGNRYLKNLVNLTDDIVLDGKINTVISGTVKQRVELQKSLTEMEERGEIIFGFYVSDSTIMSCYVQDMNEKHIHFVDGAGGGYTQASKFLKAKLNLLK